MKLKVAMNTDLWYIFLIFIQNGFFLLNFKFFWLFEYVAFVRRFCQWFKFIAFYISTWVVILGEGAGFFTFRKFLFDFYFSILKGKTIKIYKNKLKVRPKESSLYRIQSRGTELSKLYVFADIKAWINFVLQHLQITVLLLKGCNPHLFNKMDSKV